MKRILFYVFYITQQLQINIYILFKSPPRRLEMSFNLFRSLLQSPTSCRISQEASRVSCQSRSFHSIHEQKHTWSILKHIYKKEYKSANKKYVCYLLNISDESYRKFELYKSIWNEADLRVAVDGSANCLAKKRVIHTADVVCGDFDSIDPDLIEQLRCPTKATKLPHYKNEPPPTKMPQVVETPSQNATDFTKALRVAINRRPDANIHLGLYHSDGTRIDHLFGLVNTLHLVKKTVFLINLAGNTISWLLQPGQHVIQKPKGRELCSLVPFTGPTEVKTQGLEYGIEPKPPLQFGGSISTSNICSEKSTEILVETNKELLWSVDLNVGRAREMI